MTEVLWSPSEEQIFQSNMYLFMQEVNRTYGHQFQEYEALYRWSFEHLPEFYETFWKWAHIQYSEKYTHSVELHRDMRSTKWFPGSRLNFAENLLRFRDDQIAISFHSEDSRSMKLTYAELYRETAKLAKALKEAGVVVGDRIVGFMPNLPQTIIAMLAASSLGAVWSSCSPDFGVKGVMDRFGQIKPKILFSADGYFFKGKAIDSMDRIKTFVEKLPSIEQVIVYPYLNSDIDLSSIKNAKSWNQFLSDESVTEITFEQLPFDHPLYIMYSSGTTGLPKCMVQSAGGVLIHQIKELILHTDLKRGDSIFYFTTCGWMMWNWLICSLAVGAKVILYDGNPFYPDPGVLWRMVEKDKVNIFGTSAGYLAALENSHYRPHEKCKLESLKAVLSTGSPLSEEGFKFVYRHIKSDLRLSSISGGSDLNGCFVQGNPMGVVRAGEIQCRALAMNVQAFNSEGKSVIDEQGELVCLSPSPSMPIYFWDDPDGQKYFKAYFSEYKNIWRHGDYIKITKEGGVIIYGRSDATLNPGGVRIGTAEIYAQVETLTEIIDSVIIGQKWKDDTRIILFLKMAEGVPLTDKFKDQIKQLIRKNTSPRHVPAKIIAVPDIPYTLNMKKVELAVKKAIEGLPILNKDAMRNPEALDYFSSIPELAED